MKQRRNKGPKAAAVEDIKQELHREGKCFITFRVELNAPIRVIIKEYIKQQKEVHHD